MIAKNTPIMFKLRKIIEPHLKNVLFRSIIHSFHVNTFLDKIISKIFFFSIKYEPKLNVQILRTTIK